MCVCLPARAPVLHPPLLRSSFWSHAPPRSAVPRSTRAWRDAARARARTVPQTPSSRSIWFGTRIPPPPPPVRTSSAPRPPPLLLLPVPSSSPSSSSHTAAQRAQPGARLWVRSGDPNLPPLRPPRCWLVRAKVASRHCKKHKRSGGARAHATKWDRSMWTPSSRRHLGLL